MINLNILADAIVRGDPIDAEKITKAALREGIAPETVLNLGLIAGMTIVGDHLKRGKVYIPEVLLTARAMKVATKILEPLLMKPDKHPLGAFLLGTVAGDLHDLGKNLVGIMLSGAGFNVIDLGVDVPEQTFVEKMWGTNPQLVGLSVSLSTAMPVLETTLNALKDADITAKIMVGGAPVTQKYADSIGADGFAPDCASAVEVAKKLVTLKCKK